LVFGVIFQCGIFNADVVLALIVVSRNCVARERWDRPFKTCSKGKTTTTKNISVTSILIHIFPYSLGVTKPEPVEGEGEMKEMQSEG